MQPTIICTAPVPGMITINGRFAGEASAAQPLCLPVSPFGAVYLEYRPLVGDGASLARKCVFSGGNLLPDSVAEAGGLSCVAWPNGVLEIELSPPRYAAERFLLEDIPCQLIRDEGAWLLVGEARIPLPNGAGQPRLIRLSGMPALMGEIEGGGQYVAVLPADPAMEAEPLIADRIDFVGSDMLNAFVSLGDSVGHGRLEQWIADGGGLRRVSSEPVWSDGAPRWPQTAEGAMIAAVEAVLAGQLAEANGYLSPALAADAPLDAVAEVCDLCVPMKYGLPDARPCAGLLRAENEHLARVRPLYYRAEPSGGRQGPWQIEWLSLE